MATTRLIPLHVNKGKTIAQTLFDRTDYIKNPEKTVDRTISCNADYVMNPLKTKGGDLVLGFGCNPRAVQEDFLLAKREYEYLTGRDQGKRNILAYHMRQSFKPGEIDPQEALEVGYELAQRFTKGKHAYIVAVHTDKAHIHCHINIAFRNLIAELYSQDLSDKVRTAKETINRSGKSSAPYGFYGYIVDPDDHHKLIIDEPAAEIVRLMFNLREQGLTTPKIARKLNDDGVQTASERKKAQGAKRDWLRNSKERMWETGFVTKILADERYTGKHIYGKKRRVELGKPIYKSVPHSEWIIVPDAIPPIITEEQFSRVRELMKQNTKPKSDKPINKNLLFYRKIYCGSCGRSLVRSLTGKGYAYGCTTSSVKAGLGCMRGKIREDVVIETVLTVIRQQAQLADCAKSLKTENVKSAFMEIANLRGEVQSLQRLIEKANSTKLSLWEKQHLGNLSIEAYQRESEKLAEQITAYTNKATELGTQIRRLELESGKENAFVERFSKNVGIQELSRVVVDEFIKAIHVHTPDRIEIVLNYADEYKQLQSQMGS